MGPTPQMSILGQSFVTPKHWKHQDLLHRRFSSGFPSASSLKSSTHQQVKPHWGGKAKRQSKVLWSNLECPRTMDIARPLTVPINTTWVKPKVRQEGPLLRKGETEDKTRESGSKGKPCSLRKHLLLVSQTASEPAGNHSVPLMHPETSQPARHRRLSVPRRQPHPRNRAPSGPHGTSAARTDRYPRQPSQKILITQGGRIVIKNPKLGLGFFGWLVSF